jgi:hypothetical protein
VAGITEVLAEKLSRDEDELRGLEGDKRPFLKKFRTIWSRSRIDLVSQ